jgi:hypothetical protein
MPKNVAKNPVIEIVEHPRDNVIRGSLVNLFFGIFNFIVYLLLIDTSL